MARPAKQETTEQGGPIKRIELADGVVRYRLRYYLGVDPDSGKREFFNATYDSLTEAKDKAAALRTSKAEGAPVRPSKQTLNAHLKAWLRKKAGDILPRTLYDYENILRRYVFKPPAGMPLIGRTRLNKLHPQQFSRLYEYMRDDLGLSPRTIAYLRTILHGAMEDAVAMGQLARNPAKGAKAPKRKRVEGQEQRDPGAWKAGGKKARAMNQEQAQAFQEAARGDRFHALWVTLLHTGMRPEEALGLKWEHVDLDAAELHVRQVLTRRGVEGWALMPCKTERSERTLPLGPSTVRAMREWRAKQAEGRLLLGEEYENHGFVFATDFGQPLDGGNINSRNFRRICQVAHERNPGLGMGEWQERDGKRVFKPAFWTYCLRHTFASLLLEAEVDLKTVSQRLGHKSEVLTLTTYQHVMPSMEAKATEEMERMLGAGK